MGKVTFVSEPWRKAICGECAWAATWRVVKYHDSEQNTTDPHALCRYAKVDVFADDPACPAFVRRGEAEEQPSVQI